ncbi:hypothetical protein GDO81_008724 [Engystomops pustulosus]|uniref:TIL domain-containing protein n=1 Tax=Engystomops pustulosus TaxID=76066 RepID=A0AAV7CHQ1_ENGPU|nr:hypothetical protein GDO81_008724 [Engystomops pustulosus]
MMGLTVTPTSVLLLSSLCVVFLLKGVELQTNTDTKCGSNQEYETCGSACPPTCTDPEEGVCTDQCVPGCFCIKGYVKLGEGCIEKAKCLTCGKNGTYDYIFISFDMFLIRF